MLEQVTFINHFGQKMEWGKNGIFVNSNDLRDYSWDITSRNDKISKFSKGIVTKTVPIIICCQSEDEGVSIKNMLLETGEKDVLLKEHGRLVIGDYYLKCFITGSKKSNYLSKKGYMETSLTISTDYPDWIRETTVVFRGGNASAGESGKNLDYLFDYPFDYASGSAGKQLINDAFSDADFEITVYGGCQNPEIYIAGHKYAVDCQLDTGEYLKINSITKKIYKVKINGETVNQYYLQDREYYIFKKIAAGKNSVTWNGMFDFDITLLEKRSEPKWN